MSDGRPRIRLGGLWERETSAGRVLVGVFSRALLEQALEQLRDQGNLISVLIVKADEHDFPTDPDQVLYLQPRLQREPTAAEMARQMSAAGQDGDGSCGWAE
jgi:hypothetical protein